MKWGKGALALLLLVSLLLSILRAARGGGDDPPPVDPVLDLRRCWAAEHLDLADWAADKRLGEQARDHFLLAIRLDPDCQEARSRLGYRKNAAGEWVLGREPAWKTPAPALKKWGAEWRNRSGAAFRSEAAAFEKLGLELLSTDKTDLGRRFLLRAVLLDPGREEAIRSLGLVPMGKSFGTAEEVEAVTFAPEAAPGTQSFLGAQLSIPTRSRTCGSATVEGMDDPDGQALAARRIHQAQVLTSLRFGMRVAGSGWVIACAVPDLRRFGELLDKLRCFREPQLTAIKKLGSARSFYPCHFLLAVNPPGSGYDFATCAFTHCAAEDRILQAKTEGCPAWLSEAVGIDACLALLRVPGYPCVVVEASTGFTSKGDFGNPDDWGGDALLAMLNRPRPRLPDLMTAQLQALDVGDLIFADIVYRYLVATRRKGLATFILSNERDAEVGFRKAFGMDPAGIEAELTAVLTGE